MAKRKRAADVADDHSTAPVPTLRLFRVSLPLEETLEIKAIDEDDAWEKYRQIRGIVETDHVPVIVEITA